MLTIGCQPVSARSFGSDADIMAAQQGSKSKSFPHIDAFYKSMSEYESLKSELREKEMHCNMANHFRCVSVCDKFRLKLMMMTRERERDLEDCVDQCKTRMPPGRGWKDLEEMQRTGLWTDAGMLEFVNCHKGCLEDGVRRIESAKEAVRDTLNELSSPL